MGNRPFVRLALTFLLAAAAIPAAAQNLLQNPGFDTGLPPWTPGSSNVTAAWNAADVAGSPSSGSALVTNLAPAASSTVEGLTQCVPVTPGTTYDLLYRYRIAASQTGAGGVWGGMNWYSGGSCTGTPISSTGNGFTEPSRDVWKTFAVFATAPAGAGSAAAVLAVSKQAAGGSFQVLFDDAALVAAQPTTLTIPASASIHGLNGAFFHTDLWLTALNTELVAIVTARHRCLAGETCSGAAQTLQLVPRTQTYIPDVLVTLFGDAESAGAIELSWDASLAAVQATSRTYSPTLPAPTTGSGIPALPAGAAQSRAVLLGLAGSGGNLSTGFRTNVGVYNPQDVPVTVTITLFDGMTPLGTFARTFAPREPFQINDVFAAVGAGSTVTTNAWASVAASAPVFSSATVIDNQSTDSTIVFGQADPGAQPF